MRLRKIVLLEREEEVACCLQETLELQGIEVVRVLEYSDLLERMSRDEIRCLVCDLDDETESENFLRTLSALPRRPERVVFTSIFTDPRRWPGLEDYPSHYLFLPKPFRSQKLISYLFPAEIEV